MKITHFDFLERIAQQSSPYPCDNNTISVGLRFNVPVPLLCMPTLTITGLGGVVLPMAPSIELTDLDGTGAAGPNGFGDMAAWTGPPDGVLTLTPAATLAKDMWYNFSIVVRNPAALASAPSVQIAATMSSSSLGTAGDKDNMAFAPTAMASPHSFEAPSAGAGINHMDKHPLSIRTPTLLLKTIEQSSFSPCDDNVITVALRSNVPLLTTEQSDCAPKIILSGLRGSATMGDHLNISGTAAAVLEARAAWNNDGTLTLAPVHPSVPSFAAGVDYTLTFTVRNKALAQAAQTVEVKLWSQDKENMVPDSDDAKKPLYIKAGEFVVVNTTDSSTVPCAANTITVSTTFNINLLAACTPMVTIKGLSKAIRLNSTTTPDNFMLVSLGASEAVFNTTGASVDTEYIFEFESINTNYAHSREVREPRQIPTSPNPTPQTEP